MEQGVNLLNSNSEYINLYITKVTGINRLESYTSSVFLLVTTFK